MALSFIRNKNTTYEAFALSVVQKYSIMSFAIFKLRKR